MVMRQNFTDNISEWLGLEWYFEKFSLLYTECARGNRVFAQPYSKTVIGTSF